MDPLLAFSLQDQVEKYGAYVGLAAFIGLAVLTLLYFAQARELKRLRDWAGRAPERAQELEARVVAQAEDALREAEPSGTVGPAVPLQQPSPATTPVPASGNGRQAGKPAPIPMGPRPATAVAAAAARAAAGGGVATEEAPAVTGDDSAPAAPADGDRAAAAPADESAAAAPTGGDQPPGPAAGDDSAPEAPPAEDERADAEAGEDRPAEPARAGNGVPKAPPTQIPRATPRPQPRPAPAAALRAPAASRPVTVPPRRRHRGGDSRAALYTLVGVAVLAVAIAVPGYFILLSDDDPAPPPNPIAEPGGTPASSGGAEAADARPEKVVVVLNGTPIDGLASGERDKLIGAGYSDEEGMLRIDNNPDQQCQDSIVYFGPEERRQARDVARLLDVTRTERIEEETQALANSSDETGTLPADVVALLCADKAQ
jgi:LytR cell envelope-related transcriptional attenuator